MQCIFSPNSSKSGKKFRQIQDWIGVRAALRLRTVFHVEHVA